MKEDKQSPSAPKVVSAEDVLDLHAQNFGAIDFYNLCRDENITDIVNCALLSMQHFATLQSSANNKEPISSADEISPEEVLKHFAETFEGESWVIQAMEQYATLKTSSLQQENEDLKILQDQLCETYDKMTQENDKLRAMLRVVNKQFLTKMHLDQAEFSLIKEINELLNPNP